MRKMQFSKKITIVILLIITITWLIGLCLYWDEIDHFNYMLDYVQNMALGVLPYFCLSATDRLVYMQQVKQQREEKNDGMDS